MQDDCQCLSTHGSTAWTYGNCVVDYEVPLKTNHNAWEFSACAKSDAHCDFDDSTTCVLHGCWQTCSPKPPVWIHAHCFSLLPVGVGQSTIQYEYDKDLGNDCTCGEFLRRCKISYVGRLGPMCQCSFRESYRATASFLCASSAVRINQRLQIARLRHARKIDPSRLPRESRDR